MDGQQTAEATVTPPLLHGWLTRDRAASEIGVSADTLTRWARRRIGPPYAKIGRKVLYRVDALREWLRSLEETSIGGLRTRRGRR